MLNIQILPNIIINKYVDFLPLMWEMNENINVKFPFAEMNLNKLENVNKSIEKIKIVLLSMTKKIRTFQEDPYSRSLPKTINVSPKHKKQKKNELPLFNSKMLHKNSKANDLSLGKNEHLDDKNTHNNIQIKNAKRIKNSTLKVSNNYNEDHAKLALKKKTLKNKFIVNNDTKLTLNTIESLLVTDLLKNTETDKFKSDTIVTTYNELTSNNTSKNIKKSKFLQEKDKSFVLPYMPFPKDANTYEEIVANKQAFRTPIRINKILRKSSFSPIMDNADSISPNYSNNLLNIKNNLSNYYHIMKNELSKSEALTNNIKTIFNKNLLPNCGKNNKNLEKEEVFYLRDEQQKASKPIFIYNKHFQKVYISVDKNNFYKQTDFISNSNSEAVFKFKNIIYEKYGKDKICDENVDPFVFREKKKIEMKKSKHKIVSSLMNRISKSQNFIDAHVSS